MLHGAIQYLTANPVVLTAISLFAGIVLSEIVSQVRDRLNRSKQLAENLNISLAAKDWVAIWQAAADGNEILNSESLIIEQTGSTVFMRNAEISPENPRGGYLWSAELRFSNGETLMGWYYPRKGQNVASRGIMYFTYDASRKLFLGRWVGKAIDGPLSSGFVTISKSMETSKLAMSKLQEKALRHPVNILTNETVDF